MTRRKFDRFMVDVELGSNAKVGRFTDAEFRCLVTGVWALAAKADPRGSLIVAGAPATAPDVARQARCSVKIAQATLKRMRNLGMLDGDAKVHDWDELNPSPGAERSRRWRHKNVTQSVAQTSRDRHANVTQNVTQALLEVEVEEEVVVTNVTTPSASPPKELREGEAWELSHVLARMIRERDPRAKVAPESERWLRDMRLLLADRDGKAAEVVRVLRWSQQDSFWQQNILSPGKLRKHFTQLLLKQQDKGAKVVQLKGQRAEDWAGLERRPDESWEEWRRRYRGVDNQEEEAG
jgi:hypothetical protein